MARAGLIALLLSLGAIGCRGASAAPGTDLAALKSQLAVPAGWIELPKVASAARAAGDGLHAAAWGDPAAGCYLVLVSATGRKEDEAEAREAMGAALGQPGWGTAASGSGTFAQAGLTGKVRGWAQAGASDEVVSTAAACVYNEREPAACAASCDAVWAKLAGPPVIP
jgi:hypothetical protein